MINHSKLLMKQHQLWNLNNSNRSGILHLNAGANSKRHKKKCEEQTVTDPVVPITILLTNSNL